jgi:hypothetical protein
VTSTNLNEENHHNDELNIEETQLLKKEAELPIEELLKRYNGEEKHSHSSDLTKQTIDCENNEMSSTNEENSIDQKNTEITSVWLDFCILFNNCIDLGSNTFII